MRQLDSDSDGQISFDEFTRGIALLRIDFDRLLSPQAVNVAPASEWSVQEKSVAVAEGLEQWQSFDKPGGAPAAGAGKAAPADPSKVSLPTSGRGTKRKLNSQEIAQALRAFNRIDTDGSGAIDAAEMKAALQLWNPNVDDAHTRRLVEKMD